MCTFKILVSPWRIQPKQIIVTIKNVGQCERSEEEEEKIDPEKK